MKRIHSTQQGAIMRTLWARAKTDRLSPPDRTRLAKRNAGIFSVNRLYEAIEGSKVLSHGSHDMPIWGTTYRLPAGEYYRALPYDPVA